MHGPYQAEATNHNCDRNLICIACEQPAAGDLQQTKSKLPCVLQLQSSQLQVTDAALQEQPFRLRPQIIHERSIFVKLKFKHAHLKFTVYGRKQASIHTLPQCSHASVGLAQARPNWIHKNSGNSISSAGLDLPLHIFQEKHQPCTEASLLQGVLFLQY